MLPTAHGFDEFDGTLHHLNAEEEPENPDYPRSEEFRRRFGPRGVIHSFADGRVTDTGPRTRKRMETFDEEVDARAMDFRDRSVKEGTPLFRWWNSTKMLVTPRRSECGSRRARTARAPAEPDRAGTTSPSPRHRPGGSSPRRSRPEAA